MPAGRPTHSAAPYCPPTGDWGEGEARAAARPGEEDEEGGEGEEEVFGDFEDLETGGCCAAGRAMPCCAALRCAALCLHVWAAVRMDAWPPSTMHSTVDAQGLTAQPSVRPLRRRAV